MRLAAIQDELRRRGCPMDGSVDYSEPDGGTPPPPPSMSHADGLQDASKPMMEAAPTLNVLPQ
jgi:hypothetical protein